MSRSWEEVGLRLVEVVRTYFVILYSNEKYCWYMSVIGEQCTYFMSAL